MTVASVTERFNRRVERSGNDRIKLGKVEKLENGTIVARLMTVDDSLVREFTIKPRPTSLRRGQRIAIPAGAALSEDRVKKGLTEFLGLRGNDRLKVGKVTERNADFFVAEIATVDDSLVYRMQISRENGRFRRIR